MATKYREKKLKNIKTGCFIFLGIVAVLFITKVITSIQYNEVINNTEKVSNKEKKEPSSEETNKTRCNKEIASVKEKLEKLDFVLEDGFWYKKGDYTITTSSSYFNIKKDNYKKDDLKELYDILSNFIEFDQDLFNELINSLPLKELQKNHYNAIDLNKNGYWISIDYYPEDKSLTFGVNCSWSKYNSFEYEFYDNSRLDENIKFMKKYFDKDIKFKELIVHMVNESKYNYFFHDSVINYKGDIIIRYNNYLNDMEFEVDGQYKTDRIVYEVTRTFDNYKDLIKKDLTLIDKYFNEDGVSHYNEIIDVIDKKEYLEGTPTKGIEETGSYYIYSKDISDNIKLEVHVYEEKIEFEFIFKE